METNNLYIWSIKNIKSNRISIHAAQVAFFIMVSFFPFLMFFITLLKHTPISEAVLLASVQKVIPASLSSLISTWLNESFVDLAGAMPARMKGYNPYKYIDVNITGNLNHKVRWTLVLGGPKRSGEHGA